MKLKESGKINGILVIHSNDTDKPDSFSPDKPCPNDPLSKYTIPGYITLVLFSSV